MEEVPDIELVGLALCRHGVQRHGWNILNVSNHRTVRGHKPKLDWISYHQYAQCDSSDPKRLPIVFLRTRPVGPICLLQRLKSTTKPKIPFAPYVKTTVDEIGTMAPGSSFPPLYWVASARVQCLFVLGISERKYRCCDGHSWQRTHLFHRWGYRRAIPR